MNDQIQMSLDNALELMKETHYRVHSAMASTHVFHAFVVVLSRSLMTEEQQKQLETLLDLHIACIQDDVVTKWVTSGKKTSRTNSATSFRKS